MQKKHRYIRQCRRCEEYFPTNAKRGMVCENCILPKNNQTKYKNKLWKEKN